MNLAMQILYLTNMLYYEEFNHDALYVNLNNVTKRY